MNIISLGVGVQSTTIYFRSSLGYCEKADFAIFADTGNEKPQTYKYLIYLLQWQKENNGIPIIIARPETSITKSIIQGVKSEKRFVSIPLFTKDSAGKVGMLRRQCTSEFKVKSVDKKIRELLKLKRYARTPPVNIWLGISRDEITRMKEPREKYKTFVYDLLNTKVSKDKQGKAFYTEIRNDKTRFSRQDCIAFLHSLNIPIPPKSACVICPYQKDESFLETKQNPKLWDWLVKFDEQIRDASKKGITQPLFLHRSCKPLKEVDFDTANESLFDNECSGMCGN